MTTITDTLLTLRAHCTVQEPEALVTISVLEARLLIAHVDMQAMHLGAAKAAADRAKARDDTQARRAAEVEQIAVSAGNVRKHADRQVRETWRLYQDARTALAMLTAAVETRFVFEGDPAVAQAMKAAHAVIDVVDLAAPKDGG